MDERVENIQLHAGPQGAFNTREKREATNRIEKELQPVSKLMETKMKVYLHDDYKRSMEVAEKLPSDPGQYRIWASRSIVLNSDTNVHRDLDNAC